jgi:DNA-binding GntR family transcriptional regulator
VGELNDRSVGRLYDTVVQRRTLASDYHSELTTVLAKGTPDEAAESMRTHIRRGLGQVLAKMETLGDPCERVASQKPPVP